jgi:CDP-diacylglycerol--glycerol-3-phosphate 3-phosphatidyltransferase
MSILPQRLPQGVSDRLGRGLARLGFTPNVLSVMGLVGNGAAATLAGLGDLVAAGAVFLLFSAFDMLDGAVARATGKSTPYGAVLDAVLDRVSEALVLTGCAWHLAAHGAEWEVWSAFGALSGSIMVSYIRARAELAGRSLREGLLRRQERVVLLGLGLLTGYLGPVLLAMAVLAHLTALQRFVMLARALREAG